MADEAVWSVEPAVWEAEEAAVSSAEEDVVSAAGEEVGWTVEAEPC